MSDDGSRPPLAKEGRRRSSGQKSRSWREDTAKSSPKKLSNGIDASNFYNNNTTKHSRPKQVKQALKDASTNVVKQKRREVTTSLKLRRAAFKQETSLKSWPLQELGVNDYNQLMEEHLNGTNDNDDEKQEQHNDGVETHGDSTGMSSSSLDEPKRTRRQQSNDDEDLSPRKSTMRHQFQQEFLRERALEKGASPDDFQPALWCMEPRIFSVEKSNTGKRKYMVGHLGRFLDYYWRKCDPKQRHYYELIREKAPCRLYFGMFVLS